VTSHVGPLNRVAERWLRLGLVAFAVLVPLAIGGVAGSLAIPHNDDAAYRRAALGLFRTGSLELDGWGSMSLVGQLVFVQPFLWASGGESWAFPASTVALCVIGFVAGYSLARRIVSAERAALAVATVVVIPGVWLNTTSFMTDAPALAMELACLAVGATAIAHQGRARWRWLVAALAVGCFAFSIREFALAAPVAVLIAAVASETGPRRGYLVAGVVMTVAVSAIHLYSAQLPGQWASPLVPSPGALSRLTQAAATLALALSPVLVIAAGTWRRVWKMFDVGIGIAFGLVLLSEPILAVVQTGRMPRILVGNLVEPEGALGSVVSAGIRPVLIGSPGWEVANALALLAAIGMCGAVGGILGALWRGRARLPLSIRQTIGSVPGMMALFVVGYGGGLAGYSILVWMFDRYLWPVVLPLAVLLLTRPRILQLVVIEQTADTPRNTPLLARMIACALLVGIGSTSLVLTLNSNAFGAARWRMGEELVRRGFRPESIDAGIEWVGYYAPGTAVPNTPIRDPSQMWYDAWWPAFRPCAMVSSSPLNLASFRLETTDIAAYRSVLIAGPETPLFAYRISGIGCP
jgi:hypothetical protein